MIDAAIEALCKRAPVEQLCWETMFDDVAYRVSAPGEKARLDTFVVCICERKVVVVGSLENRVMPFLLLIAIDDALSLIFPRAPSVPNLLLSRSNVFPSIR